MNSSNRMLSDLRDRLGGRALVPSFSKEKTYVAKIMKENSIDALGVSAILADGSIKDSATLRVLGEYIVVLLAIHISSYIGFVIPFRCLP